MTRFIGVVLAAGLAVGIGRVALADNQDAKAVIDKAVKALGGADKINAAKAAVWKTTGTIKINENSNKFTSTVTAEGLDHNRLEFNGDFDGNPIKLLVILNGDKGWRKFGDDAGNLEGDALANHKRSVYLQIAPAMVLPLTGNGFKVESAADEKVGGKPAAVLKVTGPDGKDFQLYFDKESGLPVKLTATVAGFQGDEYAQETIFSNYKDFDGLKRATKIETKRNGEKFIDQEVTEFKVLDKADPKAFVEPKGE
jgi:hypothetical protein